MDFDHMKIDDRPKQNAWAPGNYIGTCLRCKCTFQGDKRALECADCAYSEQLVEGSATQYEMIEGEPCVHAKALRCRDTSVEDKRNCNLYECPYHPFTIE